MNIGAETSTAHPLPLLSLLWECGRLTEGQIRIHAT